MINTIILDNQIIIERKKTFYIWKLIIKKILNDKFHYNFFLEDLEKPYNLILKSDEKNIKNIYKLLKNNLLPVSTWPDLPPEIKSNYLYQKTFQLRNNLIFLNLHPQTKQQLNFLNKYKNNLKQNYYKIIEVTSNENWENYLKQVDSSYVTSINNYYQSFKLFKSKKFIINNESRNIGIFQICFITIGKLIFIRLNLGPCFFPNVTENIKKETINFISTNLFSDKIKFFLISPNLKFNEENILFNNKNNISIYSGVGWNSIKIDLKKDLKILKNKLKNSLRRDIVNKNISKKFIIKNINTHEEFSIFIENYNKKKKKKL